MLDKLKIYNYFYIRWADGYNYISDGPNKINLLIEAWALKKNPQSSKSSIEYFFDQNNNITFGLLIMRVYVNDIKRNCNYYHVVAIPGEKPVCEETIHQLFSGVYDSNVDNEVQTIYQQASQMTKKKGRHIFEKFFINRQLLEQKYMHDSAPREQEEIVMGNHRVESNQNREELHSTAWRTTTTRNRINLLITFISLITALVSLIVAFKSSATANSADSKTKANESRITIVQKEIESHRQLQIERFNRLERLAGVTSLNLQILEPQSGSLINGSNAKIKGTLSGNIPFGYNLYILTQERYNYFLQNPPVQVVSTQNRWYQDNVKFGSPGQWKIHICLADESASIHFDKMAASNNWSGFSSLPEGCRIINYVEITTNFSNQL